MTDPAHGSKISAVSSEQASLSQRAASSVIWMASQTVFTRLTSFLTQLVLAWLLAPEDFGQISLAYTITMFATLLTNPGVDDVLLQKHRHMRRWMTAAFWLSLCCGLAGMAVMATSAVAVRFLAERWGNAAYGNPTVMWMILIVAGVAPLNALSVVPVVVLRSQLRFARIAAINFGETAANQILLLVLAAAGFGAYSFVIPLPILAALRNLVLWTMVRPPIRMHLAIHRWPALTMSSGWLAGQKLLYTLTIRGDQMVLGALTGSDSLVGFYFFAYMLATQIVRVICDNVASVMMPALTTIKDDPLRMGQAAARASRTMAAISTPILALQILLAGPVVRLLFAAKWQPAIPLVQLLCIGPLAMVPALPMAAMITASGRFRAGFVMGLCSTGSFFALTTALTWLRPGEGTAAAVSAWGWLTGAFYAVWGYRSLRGTITLMGALWRAWLSSAIAAAPCAILVWILPSQRWYDLGGIALVAPLFLLIHFALLYLLDPQAVKMVWHYLHQAMSALSQGVLRRALPAVQEGAA